MFDEFYRPPFEMQGDQSLAFVERASTVPDESRVQADESTKGDVLSLRDGAALGIGAFLWEDSAIPRDRRT